MIYDPYDPETSRMNMNRYAPCSCAEAVVERRESQKAAKAELERKMLENLFSKAGIPLRYQSASFENYIAKTKEQKYALSLAKTFAKDFNSGKANLVGLYFSGTYGTGKTHLVCSIANEIINHKFNILKSNPLTENSRSVVFVSTYDLLSKIKSRYGSGSSEETVMNTFVEVPVLILDDWGKEYTKQNSEGPSWAEEKIFSIFNARYEAMRPTIITSNLSITALERRVDGALISRLHEMAVGVDVKGEDFRRTGGR